MKISDRLKVIQCRVQVRLKPSSIGTSARLNPVESSARSYRVESSDRLKIIH